MMTPEEQKILSWLQEENIKTTATQDSEAIFNYRMAYPSEALPCEPKVTFVTISKEKSYPDRINVIAAYAIADMDINLLREQSLSKYNSPFWSSLSVMLSMSGVWVRFMREKDMVQVNSNTYRYTSYTGKQISILCDARQTGFTITKRHPDDVRLIEMWTELFLGALSKQAFMDKISLVVRTHSMVGIKIRGRMNGI